MKEGRRVAVTQVVGRIEKIVIAINSLVRCQVNLQSRLPPLISCLKSLRTQINSDHHLTNDLEDNVRVRHTTLIDEVLGLVKPGPRKWFDIRAFPKLTNGGLKICSLNAGFGVLLRSFPDIRQNLQPGKPLSREVELVLDAEEKTSLVGVKKALHEYYSEPDYWEESKGGIAAEVVRHLIEALGDECGQQFRFNHIVSEELGFLSQCPVCRSNYEEVTSLDPSQRFTSVQVNGEERKKVVLQDELSEKGWATCQKCCTKNGVIPSPKRVLFEFLGGGALSLQGIEEDVNLGESTYQATVIVHFDPEEDHFWISVKDETGCWWRIDDFCGSEDLWRRQYLRQKDILVTGRHRLDANVHLLLLEEVCGGKKQCRTCTAGSFLAVQNSSIVDLVTD